MRPSLGSKRAQVSLCPLPQLGTGMACTASLSSLNTSVSLLRELEATALHLPKLARHPLNESRDDADASWAWVVLALAAMPFASQDAVPMFEVLSRCYKLNGLSLVRTSLWQPRKSQFREVLRIILRSLETLRRYPQAKHASDEAAHKQVLPEAHVSSIKARSLLKRSGSHLSFPEAETLLARTAMST